MNYDEERQRGLLTNLLGNISPWRIAALLLLSACLVLGLVGLHLVLSGRQRQPDDPGDRLYKQFLRHLKASGVERQPADGPRSLAARVQEEQPTLATWAEEITRCYERYAYGNEPEALPQLRDLIKESPQKSGKFPA